jgi:hypothetical protein
MDQVRSELALANAQELINVSNNSGINGRIWTEKDTLGRDFLTRIFFIRKSTKSVI